ncbi:MAG: hypothetical protein JSS32_02390 [Verrucomicrobia bacterium]|nr:hypothetical protein [Verrucomicrobiota bacterium]
MILATLFSSLLLAGPMSQEEAVQIIREAHLDTVEGRLSLLQGDLMRILQTASALNAEIDQLSQEIARLTEEAKVKAEERENPPEEVVELATVQNEVDQIAELTEIMNGKMTRLAALLPVLQNALRVDEDMNGLDDILSSESELSEAQLEQLRHLAELYRSVQENL